MFYPNKSIIIGNGNGISRFLSKNLGIKAISSNDLKNIDISKFQNIIYTSCDPTHSLNKENITSYLTKNIRSIFYILESNFSGSMTYISSIESGSFDVRKDSLDQQIENMYTPYSFSKFSAESLFINHPLFNKCTILRVGLLWPAKDKSNFNYAIKSNPNNIGISLESEYYITPYSLILNFIKKVLKENNNKLIFGNLSSSNKVKLSTILSLRNVANENIFSKNKYCYKTKNKDLSLLNLIDDISYDWEKEKDFNKLIAESLIFSGKEDILPFWNK